MDNGAESVESGTEKQGGFEYSRSCRDDGAAGCRSIRMAVGNEEKAVIVQEKALQMGAKSLIMNGFSVSF